MVNSLMTTNTYNPSRFNPSFKGLDPLPPKGHLVKDSLLNKPGDIFRDYIDSAKTFIKL